MTQEKQVYWPPPTNHVFYDYADPSPHFSKEQVGYIEAINKDFGEEDLARIRKIEWFERNLNVDGMAEGAIPGLRAKPGVACVYVRRISNENLIKWSVDFLANPPHYFPEQDRYKCAIPCCRVVLAKGDRFYPFVFHGNLDAWRRWINDSAEAHETLTGWFDRGKFNVSDGTTHDFAAIAVDSLERGPIPEDW